MKSLSTINNSEETENSSWEVIIVTITKEHNITIPIDDFLKRFLLPFV